MLVVRFAGTHPGAEGALLFPGIPKVVGVRQIDGQVHPVHELRRVQIRAGIHKAGRRLAGIRQRGEAGAPKDVHRGRVQDVRGQPRGAAGGEIQHAPRFSDVDSRP